MQNIHDKLEQIIDNLLLIKNSSGDFSSIEKDILLQNLREAYLLILRHPVSDEMKVVDNQEEKADDFQEETVPEKVFENQDAIREEEQLEEDNEEMDADILAFVKEVPKADSEEKSPNQAERDLFSEPTHVPEPVKAVEPEPVVEAKPEPVVVPEPEPIDEPEAENLEDSELTLETIEPEPIPEPVVVTEPVPVPEPEVAPEPELTKPAEAEVPEISEVSEPKPEPVPEPVVEEVQDPEPEEPVESKAETVRKFAQILELEPQSQAETEKPQQRSLNDLFNQQKQDLSEKFQQTKITDLTKAMSINDKFLYIRELFKNKSEEFSRAIHTLNNCENIEEAFDIMEGLKKQYFWDSTSSAYLSLCDLVRRKF